MTTMNNMKKLPSLLLALVMVLAMAVPAMAEDVSKLTINTASNHTYKVYQLLVGDVSGLNGGEGTLSNVTDGQNLDLGENETVQDFIGEITNLSGEELGNTAASYIKGDPVEVVTGDGTAKTVDVANGYYIVVDSFTATDGDVDDNDVLSRYMVAVVGDTIMTPKTTKPDIDKKIIDADANKALDASQKTDTAAIGDTIEYEVTGNVPDTEGYSYYYYVLHDTLSKGLTLQQDSFVVTIGSKTLVKGSEYYVYVTENDDGTTSFDLALENLKTLVNTADNGVTVGADISIKYTATVNDNAKIGSVPNTNTVKLEYSNNPNESTRSDVEDRPGTPEPGTATGETPVRITKTYVTELTILKVDNTGNKLEGAQFTLTGENLNKVIVETSTSFREAAENETAEYYQLVNGTFTKTAPSSAAEGEEGYNADKYITTVPTHVRVTTITTSTAASGDPKAIVGAVNEAGYVTFTGLNAGTYTLTETVTPAGYNTMEPITFTITASQNGSTNLFGGNISWVSNNENIVLDAGNGVFDATIVNYPGSTLPSTGGMGTTVIYTVGGLLVAAAVILMICKKRSASK